MWTGANTIDAQVLLDSIQVYKHRHALKDPVLLVIHQDIFNTNHTFVFGLARQSVGAAVVSTSRLTNEYYGRQTSDDDLIERNHSLIPVICGSAIQNTGVKMIMDTVAHYLPSPLERAAIEVIEPKTKEQKTLEPKNDAPLAAYVFKTIADPYAGKLTIFRVFSGTLNADSAVYNAAKKTKEKIGQILQLEGKTQKPAESAITGDIMALATNLGKHHW